MAGAMRKMAVYLGLVEDDERYDDYDDDDAHGGQARGGRDSRHPEGAPGRPVVALREDPRSAVTAMPGTPERRGDTGAMAPGKARSADPYRITTIHPRTYNEAKQIGEAFRDATPVIMNLTEMDDSDAKRLVDFAAGLVFGLRGSIERVTNKVFLLSPANVEVTAEDKARMVESGFFNQS